jgi:pSer/pThr/pTyr-binding forkhead associated (FHA) protein
VKLYLTFEKRETVLMNGANVIGRAPDATIQIDSPGVSRHHARILVSEGDATLEDLGSKNGTLLNGNRTTTPARLSDGSQIRLGTIVLTFRMALPTSPTQSVPME